LSQGSSD